MENPYKPDLALKGELQNLWMQLTFVQKATKVTQTKYAS